MRPTSLRSARRLAPAAGLCALLSLGACATPYQPMGLSGGVKATEITSNIAQVAARGSFLTDPDKVEQYVLRKAAEITVANGYDRFEVLSSTDRSRSLQAVAGYAGFAGGGYPTGGLSLPFVRPGESVLIRMSRNGEAVGGATQFDARDVLAHLARPRA